MQELVTTIILLYIVPVSCEILYHFMFCSHVVLPLLNINLKIYCNFLLLNTCTLGQCPCISSCAIYIWHVLYTFLYKSHKKNIKKMVNLRVERLCWEIMIPGGSNDERLTNIDTRNCYILMCKVAQYLASFEALLRAFTYALVNTSTNACIKLWQPHAFHRSLP